MNIINKILTKTLGIRIQSVNQKKMKELPLKLNTQWGSKFLFTYNILKKIDDLDGSIVECGVGWGRSINMFSLLVSIMNKKRDIWGFDSFEGYSEPSSEDKHPSWDLVKGDYFKECSKESVIRLLLNSGIDESFIENRIKLVKGFYPESFTQYNNKPIALLQLSCDLYQPHIDCLECFYEKVVRGGIIIFDDYGLDWTGAEKAINEFFENKEKLKQSSISRHYYIVKD